MRILGIHFNGPQASLCLVENGKIVCAIKEESISRKPADENFPELAFKEIQKKYKITPDEIDHVAIAYKPIRKIEDFIIGEMLSWPLKLQGFPKRLNQCLLQQFNLSKAIKKYFGSHRDIIFLDHFLSLAAYEYYAKPTSSVIFLKRHRHTYCYEFLGNDINIRKSDECNEASQIPPEYAAIGAALLVAARYHKIEHAVHPEGFQFDSLEIENYLKRLGCPYIHLESFDIKEKIAQGKMIAIFKGPCPFHDKLSDQRVIIHYDKKNTLKLENEPLAFFPQDAWRVFRILNLDYLVLENWVIAQKDLRKDLS